MKFFKDDYVYYYWSGDSPGPRLVKLTDSSNQHIVGTAILSSKKLSHPVDIRITNSNIHNLIYISKETIHNYPHLLI